MLLLGNSVIAPIGWLTNVCICLTVLFQPSSELLVSVWMTGRPEVVTTVVKAPSTGVAGVMISLWLSVVALLVVVFSMRVNVAGTPLTVTASTLKVLFARVLVVPWKSKEYDDRGAPVVLAWMVVVESDSVVVAAALFVAATPSAPNWKLMS